ALPLRRGGAQPFGADVLGRAPLRQHVAVGGVREHLPRHAGGKGHRRARADGGTGAFLEGAGRGGARARLARAIAGAVILLTVLLAAGAVHDRYDAVEAARAPKLLAEAIRFPTIEDNHTAHAAQKAW